MISGRTVIAGLGVAGVLVWLGVFAAGLLIDSTPYRDAFRVTGAEQQAAASDPNIELAVGSPSFLNETLPSASGGPSSMHSEIDRREVHPADLRTFASAVLFFTPLNAAILSFLAALVGGCASWLSYEGETPPEAAGPEERARIERRLKSLQENPLTAMLRGFAVYLAVIAGVYIIAGDPFDQATASQYVRFAGTVSLMAFVLGYDATRLRDLFDSLPRLAKKN